MTYEEAIKVLSRNKYEPAHHLAIEVLRKQIPQRPNSGEEYTCPTCKGVLPDFTAPAYCKCGQKLDWEEIKKYWVL